MSSCPAVEERVLPMFEACCGVLLESEMAGEAFLWRGLCPGIFFWWLLRVDGAICINFRRWSVKNTSLRELGWGYITIATLREFPHRCITFEIEDKKCLRTIDTTKRTNIPPRVLRLF